jgi:MFS family permease
MEKVVKFRDVLFGNRKFLALWIGQVVSQFGDRLSQMVLIGLVTGVARGDTFEMAKLMFFAITPVFFVSPLAGVYVDRWDRKKTMVVSDILRGLLVLTIPFLLSLKAEGKFDSLLPIYGIVFLMFSATRFFIPAKLAIIPSLVARKELLVANSLSSTTRILATVIGLALGGVIFAWIGPSKGFYLSSLAYFLSAIAISTIFIEKAPSPLKEKIKVNLKLVFRELKEGFKYVKGNGEICFIFLSFFLMMSGAGAVYVVIIVFVEKALQTGTEGLGFLASLSGVGAFFGSLVLGSWGQKISRRKLIFIGFLGSGAGLILFTYLTAIFSSFFLSGLLSILLGITFLPILISSNTSLQELIPSSLRGRVFSAIEVVIHFAFLIFMMLAGLLGGVISNQGILISIGIVFLIWGMGGMLIER